MYALPDKAGDAPLDKKYRDEDFQHYLLSVMQRNPQFAIDNPVVLTPHYWHDTLRTIVRCMQSHVATHGAMPTVGYIKGETKQDMPQSTESIDWLEKEVPPYIEYRAYEEFLVAGVDQMQRGDYAAIAASLKAASEMTIGPRMATDLVTYEQCLIMDSPDWLIRGLIMDSSVSILYGASGSFKSFVLMDLSLRSAAGMPWHGRRTTQRPVIYIAAEGGHGLKKRVRAWNALHQFKSVRTAEELARSAEPKHAFRIYPKPVNLTKAAEVDRFIAAMRPLGFERPIIAIDTLSASMPGADEDGARDMSQVVAAMYRIRNELDATVVGVHHSGKDKSRGLRGSSSLEANVDCVIVCEREDDEKGFLQTQKMKDGPAGLEFRFRMETVELGQDRHGDMVTSLVALEDTTPSMRSPEAELRFKVGCNLPPGQSMGLKKLNETLGKSWGTSSAAPYERAFVLDQAYVTDTPSGVRVLKRVAAPGTKSGKIECTLESGR